MSRVDPNSFANALMGGLQTGIQLGQNADAQRFARERAGAQDRQTQFGNTLALDAQAMRRQEIAAIAAERSAARIEKENARTAARQLMSVASSGKPFDPNDPAFFPLLDSVDEKTQQYFYKAAADNKFIQKKRSQYDSSVAAGIRFTKEEADDFARFDIDVDGKHILKSDRQIEEETDAADKESIIVTLNENGWLPGGDIEKAKRNSTKHLANILKMRMDEVAVQQAAIAEQQAAAQKQQLEQQSMQAATPALGRYRNGTATDADLIQLKNAGLITASGIEPNKPMEDKSVFARKQIEDIDKELQFVDQQLMEMGVASRARVSDPVTINQDKAKDGAPGTSFWGNKKEATPEYTKTQQLLSRRDQLLQARQQVGTQLVGGQQPAAQVDGRAIIQQFTAQNGRKPTTQELADLLRRASQGTPQQPVLQR